MESSIDQVWKDLEKKDELTHCETCGKKIWKYWHVVDSYYKKKKLKEKSEDGFPEMTKCGPCFFKKGD